VTQLLSARFTGPSGVEDDGVRRGLDAADLEQSLATLHRMAEEARAAAALVRLLPGRRGGRRCAIVRVHRLCVPDVTYTTSASPVRCGWLLRRSPPMKTSQLACG